MIQNIVLVILACAALICTYLSIRGQQLIMATHEKVLSLITTFRKEIHETVREALQEHVQAYHK